MDISRLLPHRLFNPPAAQANTAASAEKAQPSIAQSVVVALSLSRTTVESPKEEDPQGIMQALRRAELETSENRKAMARAELERLKERIAHLKMMLAFMGPSAAKGLAAQIKALASQMGNLASILKEGGSTAQPGSGGGVSSAVAGVTQAVKGVLDRQAGADAAQAASAAAGEEGQAARVAAVAQAQAANASQAAQRTEGEVADDERAEGAAPDEGADAAVQALEDAAAALTSALQDAAKPGGGTVDPQRREDARRLREALDSLKQLISMYKNSRQRQTGGDGNHPDVDEAVRSLKGVESAIGSLGGASAALGGLSL